MPRNAVVSAAALLVLVAAAELLWSGVSAYVIVVRPDCDDAACDSGIDAGDWVGLALLLAGGIAALRLALPVALRPEAGWPASRLAAGFTAAVVGLSGLAFF